jgi:hypothetical protein
MVQGFKYPWTHAGRILSGPTRHFSGLLDIVWARWTLSGSDSLSERIADFEIFRNMGLKWIA